MESLSLESLFDKNNVVQIGADFDSDINMATMRVEGKVALGALVIIYEPRGSAVYSDAYMALAPVLEGELNEEKVMSGKEPSTEGAEIVELIDAHTDKSILSLFKTASGFIGIQTQRSSRTNATGPVVWVSAPVDENSSDILKRRSQIFTPFFAAIKELAPKVNVTGSA